MIKVKLKDQKAKPFPEGDSVKTSVDEQTKAQVVTVIDKAGNAIDGATFAKDDVQSVVRV